MKRQKGLTLIELLVVIAIIGILAGIVFPVLARARASAKQNACASNLKQLGYAVSMYAGDWDGYLPPYTTHVKLGQGTDRLLVAALDPHVKDREVWFCPADRYARRVAHPEWMQTDHTLTSYVTDPLPARDPPTRIDYIDDLEAFFDTSDVPFAWDDHAPGKAGAHRGGVNQLLYDWHVKWRWVGPPR